MSMFDWRARIFAGEDGKIIDPAESFWWKRKGTIVECRDGVSQRAESGGAGRKKRGSGMERNSSSASEGKVDLMVEI